MQHTWSESIKGPLAGMEFQDALFSITHDIVVDKKDVVAFLKMEPKVRALMDAECKPLSAEVDKFRKVLEGALDKTKQLHEKSTYELLKKCISEQRLDDVERLVDKHHQEFDKTVNVLVKNACATFRKQLEVKDKAICAAAQKKVAKLTGCSLDALKLDIALRVDVPLFKHSGKQLLEKVRVVIDKARKDANGAQNREDARLRDLKKRRGDLGNVLDLLKSRDVELIKSFEAFMANERSSENMAGLRALSKVKDGKAAVAYVQRFVGASASEEINLPSKLINRLRQRCDEYTRADKDPKARKEAESALLKEVKLDSDLYDEIVLNLGDTFSRWVASKGA